MSLYFTVSTRVFREKAVMESNNGRFRSFPNKISKEIVDRKHLSGFYRLSMNFKT